MPKSEKLQRLEAATATSRYDAETRRTIVNVRVPTSLSADIISDHGSTLVDLEGSGPSIDAYSAARGALKALHDSLAAVDEAHSNALVTVPVVPMNLAKGAEPILTKVVDPSRAAALTSAMAESARRASIVHQKGMQVVDATVAKLDGFIEAKCRHPRPEAASTIAEANDIRSYLKSLAPENRSSFVHSRIEQGDLTVCHALLNCSPWAVGLDDKAAANLKGMMRERFAPNESKQRAALLDVQRKLGVAMQTYTAEYVRRLPDVRQDPAEVAIAALRGKVAA